MGTVLFFDKNRTRNLVKEQLHAKDNDLNERIERIKLSIARINRLMAELREKNK